MQTATLSELPQTQLEDEQSTIVPAATEPFVVLDHFTPKNPLVKIAPPHPSFVDFFKSVVEPPMAECAIYSRLLTYEMVDGQIFSRIIGGRNKACLYMQAVYDLLLRQPALESGYLVIGGCANVFYYPKPDIPFKAVSLHATEEGWLFRVNEIVDGHHSKEDFWEQGCKIHVGAPFQGQSPRLVS